MIFTIFLFLGWWKNKTQLASNFKEKLFERPWKPSAHTHRQYRTDQNVLTTGMKSPDQGHLHPKLEVPRLTCPGREANPASTMRGEQLISSYSEHLHMRARPVENARDKTFKKIFISWHFPFNILLVPNFHKFCCCSCDHCWAEDPARPARLPRDEQLRQAVDVSVQQAGRPLPGSAPCHQVLAFFLLSGLWSGRIRIWITFPYPPPLVRRCNVTTAGK